MDNFSIYSCLGLVLSITTIEALLCMSCDNVADPRLCSRLLTCSSNEMCYVQHKLGTNGNQFYKLGCVDRNVCLGSQTSVTPVGRRNTYNSSSGLIDSSEIQSSGKMTRVSNDDFHLCTQCCDKADGCNKDLCTSHPATNLRCLTCAGENDPKNCQQIKECGRDQFCYVHKGLNRNIATYSVQYDFGCMGSLQCQAFKNVFASSCVACCNDTDLCNYDACDHWSPNTPGAAKLVTSSAPRTTVPKLDVHINGPDKGHFWRETQLSCVTNPAADAYRWKFNGTFSMPMGVTEQLISGHTSGGSGADILHIKNLTESTFGTYTCAATLNGYTAEQSHFIGIFAEKPTVNILKPPVASSFSLQCQVTGYPAPHMQWDFVPKSPRSHGIPPGVQFREEAYKSTLVVSHYNPVDHDGSWYCKATNTAGSTVSEVHIP